MINELLTYENSQIRPVHRQMQARDRIGPAVRRVFARNIMSSDGNYYL